MRNTAGTSKHGLEKPPYSEKCLGSSVHFQEKIDSSEIKSSKNALSHLKLVATTLYSSVHVTGNSSERGVEDDNKQPVSSSLQLLSTALGR